MNDDIKDRFCYHRASMEAAVMLHGIRRRTNSPNKTLFRFLHIRSKTTIPQPNTLITKLGTCLLVASISKSLSEPGGTRNLNNGESSLISLSEALVLQILRRSSVDVSKKIGFFKWCSLRHNYKHSAGTYSQMLKTLCINPVIHKDDIFHFLDSMDREGVVLDSSTFKFLLDSFIKSGNFHSALEILDRVENILDNLNPDAYSSVLIALVRSNNLNMALFTFFKLLDSVSDKNESLVDNAACSELLVELRKAGMQAEFRNVFDKLREKKKIFPVDIKGYNVCIHGFGNWGELETSLNLFKEMKEKSLRLGNSFAPDLCTYNSLIQALCFKGKVKDALIVWEELKSSGHEPDAFTYRIIIQGCCKCYMMNDATKIFSEMQHNGFRPNTIVYNSMLDGFLKSGKLMDACQLFEKMVDDGVRASCWTYNILIDGLFKNRRGQAAYELFRDLKKKGQFVDGITYSIVIFHICREGLVEEALELVEEMEARGFVVDLVTITHLLVSINKQGRKDWTERLLKHIRNGNLMPTILKWKSNMEASMKYPTSREKDFTSMFPGKGDFHEILNLINLAESNTDRKHSLRKWTIDPWSSSPYMDHLADEPKSNIHLLSSSKGKRVQEKGLDSFDINMVNTYLSIYLTKGKLSLACKLYEIFTDLGVDPVNYTYNSLMSSLVKKGYLNEAYGVLSEMVEKVSAADVATYNMIIQALGKMGRADLASAVLRKLTDGGFLDMVMYNTVINVLGKGGRLKEVNMVIEQMKKSGINPDVVTYNTLIEVHSKAGRLKEAQEFLKMMVDAGCAPNHVTDTTLEFLEKEIEKQKQKAKQRS
ncbi:pentatricopeptide repeat-containing protein At4g01570 [Cynara cardunculus var. scolymus]|uniref:pentatricopeptide repeat-containing protein At4g01570 n=1 Tax=Cynara cardunculus var. scolymus TaxID=59895 RepID=UPI000D628F5D|nr:pentatricopeptide repeat-containing protein At4g01570 [Cynara cardunculus var. scolymus]